MKIMEMTRRFNRMTISRRLKKFAWQGQLQWHESEDRSWFYYRCKESAKLYLFLHWNASTHNFYKERVWEAIFA